MGGGPERSLRGEADRVWWKGQERGVKEIQARAARVGSRTGMEDGGRMYLFSVCVHTFMSA